MKQYSVNDILDHFGDHCTVQGHTASAVFTNARPILEAEADSLVWVSPRHPDKIKMALQTKALVIVSDESLLLPEILNTKCIIVTKEPRLFFLRLVKYFFEKKHIPSIHPSAIIHPEAKLAASVSIGPLCYLGKCTIGADTVIHGNCHIYDDVVIGNRVLIQAGTVIGGDGFGYAKNENGELEKFPHIGGVLIEDDVEIGTNTSIDRGTLGNTWIKGKAKIDNLVHIAHNVVIGRNTAVIAHAMIGGSTVIGDNSWISPSACIRDGLTIGNHVMVGMAAVVTKNIPDHETWTGSPAMPLEEFKALLKKQKS